MVTENNSQINTFTGGMNTDTSYQMLQDSQYVLAKNLRLFSLNGTGESSATNAQGELRPIEGVDISFDQPLKYFDKHGNIVEIQINKILASTNIRNYGLIIVSDSTDHWYVARFKNTIGADKFKDDTTNDINQAESKEDDDNKLKVIFGPSTVTTDCNKFSISCKWEDTDNVKLYIADGEHPLMLLNVAPEQDKYNIGLAGNVEKIFSYPQITFTKPIFAGLVAGSLKPALVQYSYQLYNKNGISSEVSPTTKLIPIVNIGSQKDGKSVKGYKYGAETGVGVKLEFKGLCEYQKYLDRMFIYRITYQQNGQLPTIERIYDKGITNSFTDSGQVAMSTLTLEEYNSMSGVHIIPKIIESKNDRLFAADIKTMVSDIDNFASFDARAFSFTPIQQNKIGNPVTYLYDYNTQSAIHTGPNTDRGLTLYPDEQNQSWDSIYSSDGKCLIPDDCDCFNPYCDINKQYPDYDQNTVSDQLNVGPDYMSNPRCSQYCRYTSDGVYFGGTGKNISWRFIVTELSGDSSESQRNNIYGNCGNSLNGIRLKDRSYFKNKKISYIRYDGNLEPAGTIDNSDSVKGYGTYLNDYSNPNVTYSFKSLRRDELYRYGIILYDKFGQASPVKWIADIRTPNMNYRGCEAFVSHGNLNYYDVLGNHDKMQDLVVRPLGIQFTVNIPDDLKSQVTSYEIVRCNRSDSDIATISQGVVSRPVQCKYWHGYRGEESQLYSPTGFLTTGMFWAGITPFAEHREWGGGDGRSNYFEVSNTDNNTIFQFVSPEIVYQKETMESELKDRDLQIVTVKYLFGSDGRSNYNPASDIERALLNEDANDRVDAFRRAGEYVKPSIFQSTAWDSKSPDAHEYRMPTYERKQLAHPSINNLNFILNPLEYYYDRDNHGSDNLEPYQMESLVYNSNLRMMGFSDANAQTYYNIRAKYWSKPVDIEIHKDSNLYFSVLPLSSDDTVLEEGTVYMANSLFSGITEDNYTYIKLYNQSNDVYARTHFTYGNGDQDIATDINKIQGLATLVNMQDTFDIKSISFATEPKWNEFSTNGSESTDWGVNYQNSVVSVGKAEFVNWVNDGKLSQYNVADKDIYVNDDGSIWPGPDRIAATRMGIGGRCMLMEIDPQSLHIKNLNRSTGQSDPLYVGHVNALYDAIGTAHTIQTPNNAEELTTLYNVNAPGINALGIEDARYDSVTTLGQSMYSGWSKSGIMSIYRNSVCGTFLVNLRKNVSPYNGYDFMSKKLSMYYSYGDYYNVNNTVSNVYDGDCFIQPMEYVSMHKFYDAHVAYPVTQSVIYAIPVETNINLAYTNGYEISRNLDQKGITNLQIEPSNVYNVFVQTEPAYVYNTAYSSNDKTRTFAAYDTDDDTQNKQHIDYRCYYSSVKSNDETIDTWVKFQSGNYLDVDTRYGAITELRTFKNELMFWQENATGKFSVNERTAITDNSNMPLILGTGDVLSRYDYIDNTSGMHKEEYADTMSDSVLYWFDDDNQEIKAYGGGTQVLQLSKAGHVQNTMERLANVDKVPVMVFDNKYNELMCNTLSENNHGMSMVYSEQNKTFTSLYDIDYEGNIKFFNGQYLLHVNNNNLKIGQLNKVQRGSNNPIGMSDNILTTYIEYVVNKQPIVTKVFDNQEIITINKPNGEKLHDNYFTVDHNYKWVTDTNNAETDNLGTTAREGNFRYAIPRANNAKYGDRIRGKYMISSIEDTNPDCDASISYVITKFRTSWA